MVSTNRFYDVDLHDDEVHYDDNGDKKGWFQPTGIMRLRMRMLMRMVSTNRFCDVDDSQ